MSGFSHSNAHTGHVLAQVWHGIRKRSFKLFPGVTPSALRQALRNGFELLETARLVLIDWEGVDVPIDGTLETGVYTLEVVEQGRPTKPQGVHRHLKLQLQEERLFTPESRAIELYPGVWSISTEHHMKTFKQVQASSTLFS